MNKEKYIRLLRKDYLLFKRLRQERHALLESGLSNILTNEDFYFIDSEVMQSLCFKMIGKGVRGALHRNYNKKRSIDLKGSACQAMDLTIGTRDDYKDDWIFVVPTEWYLYGGFFVSMNTFFANFLALSNFVQDDFDVYNSTLDCSFEFRGDRSEGDLVYCEIVSRGPYFDFVTDVPVIPTKNNRSKK